ncbi:response regulator transcription factor [Acetatifactor aquisgranensis]|uniref:response regulator transcription factor n=1 Tax=Acetatifactor aquisgranensis TaxID=2941233 RepID=UPI00203D0FBB|nr:response regulator transcription factor [Acetatifactor aquisgranensis]
MGYEYLRKKRILLVDDEEQLRDMVSSMLTQEGYTQVRTAGNMAEALDAAEAWKPELAILDVMLPDGDGFSLLQRLRETTDVPVLFLTARGEDEDKFRGFGLGADDYVVKPFLPRELMFRVSALLRRSYREECPRVRLAACELDFERAEVIKGEERLSLTAKEFELLNVLYRNAGRIVTIDGLCEAAWGDNPYGYENSLMAHIRRIREKIEENPSKPVSLLTVKGLGYKLVLAEKQGRDS